MLHSIGNKLTVCFKNLKMFLPFDQAVPHETNSEKNTKQQQQKQKCLPIHTHTEHLHWLPTDLVMKAQLHKRAANVFKMQALNCGDKE